MGDEPEHTTDADHATDERHTLGEQDGPMEDALEASFTRQVLEGTQRLSRPWGRSELFTEGFLIPRCTPTSSRRPPTSPPRRSTPRR